MAETATFRVFSRRRKALRDGTRTAHARRVLQRPARFDHGEDVRERSFRFACRVAMFCKQLYARGGVCRVVVPQLVNCATSYAGMLEEARAAESDRDFVSKCSIGLKEIRESHVRLRICERCGFGPADEANTLTQEASELVAITTAILRNKKRHMAAKRDSRPSHS